MLERIALQPDDVGPGLTQDRARVQTNDEAAKARPDTDNARRQYADWGQVLAYDVQYGAPPSADLVFNAATARLMNTVTVFDSADGAAASLAYVRELTPGTVANVLVNEGAGTQISGTQVVKDIDMPAKGDESFAWRVSGKATFEDGFVVNFVADAVFVRVGRVTGSVTTVALGEPPDRSEVLRFVDRFVARARQEGA